MSHIEHATLFPIMIVDDNQDAAESLVELLKMRGHDARFANDARSALALLSEFKPQVMLVDIALPDVDGFELARRIRESEGASTPRLIALTGYGQASARERAMAAGFDDFLVKPLSYDKIESFLGSEQNSLIAR
jgi:CheY-like chemotaxis protein